MKRVAGFSLVELMISMVLGLVVTAGVIQVFVSTRTTNSLNQAIAQVQESGRYIALRIQQELREVGRYDSNAGRIDDSVDLTSESNFVLRQPVALGGDYSSDANLGSEDGSASGNDQIVVNLLAREDCTGNSFAVTSPNELHIVNHYFVDGEQLKCVGYNGRYLRGLQSNSTPSSAVVLLDNVASFQVEYGISADVADNNSAVVRYVNAGQLANARLGDQQVVSIRLAVLIKSETVAVPNMATNQVSLLSETAITLDNNHYFQVFSVSVALRNSLNYVGSAAL